MKKTLKLAARIIGQSFAVINGLQHLDDAELSIELGKAYFGNQADLYSLFSGCQGISQKVLQRAVQFGPFAADLTAILQNRFMQIAVERRNSQVLKTVTSIRNKLKFTVSIEDLKLEDLVKRTPWPLADLMKGATLCLQIIAKDRSS